MKDRRLASLQGELGAASALLGGLAGRVPRLTAGGPAEEARLAGQLRLLGALIKALDRRSLGSAGRGDLVGLLIRGGWPPDMVPMHIRWHDVMMQRVLSGCVHFGLKVC